MPSTSDFGAGAGGAAGELLGGPVGAAVGEELGRALGEAWDRSGVGEDPRGAAQRLIAQRPPLAPGDLAWFADAFQRSADNPLPPGWNRSPLAEPWREAASMLRAEAARRLFSSAAPAPR
ncbi:MAG: hypothetical protein EBR82_62200, partial [Caulobacteraceae bacterium]|nr:hypothetical protein [Caulobacteraceae bacterium]